MRKYLPNDEYLDRVAPIHVKYRDKKREHEREALKEALDGLYTPNCETCGDDPEYCTCYYRSLEFDDN